MQVIKDEYHFISECHAEQPESTKKQAPTEYK